MSDAGSQLLDIEPPEIRFPSGGSEDEASCLVQVSNRIDNCVAFKFKVKTRHVKCYNVKPKSGILQPRSHLELVVTRKGMNVGASDSNIQCKDTFMLQCARVNADTTVADAEELMKAGGHQVKKLGVVFVSPDQPYRPIIKASEAASPPGSSMSGTENRSSFRPDAPTTTAFEEVTGIADEMAKLSPTASVASVCVEEFPGEFVKAKSLEEPILPEGGGGDDADDQLSSLLMADANCQDEEEKEEPILPEGGGRDVDDQEAILHVMNIDGNCQEEEEEPILPEGGGCGADDQDHVNQELDNQNQSGLCPGHGTSDTEAQHDDPTNQEEHVQSASNDGRTDIDPSREDQLPFTKTLRIWESIVSWEAFRLLPQRPHFRPLVELDPEIREQEAIRFTVDFATLVEKIAALKPDVSIGLLHRYLKQLDNLELLGFDVKAAVDRVSSLLAIQERRGQIQCGLNDVRGWITKKAEDKVKLEESIKQMDRELKEAESKQASRMSLKQEKEAEAASWELELSNVNDKVSSAEDQFKALVSAPW